MSDVLVVDDEDSTCRLLAALLRRRGFSVACATRGADCLQILSSQTPRLVILDVMMPEMDGLSVLRSMRADQRLKTVPVVLIQVKEIVQRRLKPLRNVPAQYRS